MSEDPAQRGRWQPGDWAVGATFLAAVAVALLVVPLGTLVDDSFITLRVTDHVLESQGWVYNPGERVNATTSPLHVLALLPLRAAGIPGPWALALAFGGGLLALGLVIYGALRRESRALAVCAAFFSASGSNLLLSFGMETSLFLACAAATAWAVERRRRWLAGVLAGLTAIARPEGLAMVALVLAAEYLGSKRVAWQVVAGWAAVVGPWLCFSWAYFGSPLPHSVAVKAAQSGIGWWASQPWWPTRLLLQQTAPYLTLPLAALGLATIGRRLIGGRPFLALFVGFGLVQVIAYSALRAPAGYPWYYAPGNLATDLAVIAALFAIGRAIGGTSLGRRLTGPAPEGSTRGNAVLGGLACALAFALMFTLGATSRERLKPIHDGRAYTQIGRWIATHTASDARVAATEIGYIGYYSGRYMLDIHGLVHPGALPALRRETWDWWFAEHPPTVVVVHDPPWPGEPASPGWPPHKTAEFRRDYDLAYEAAHTLVYVRRPGTH